ncbi:CC/Se motif family (seleno)protein [Clostridium sp.]|uniref:CC/Se motif family (seleno)protein n=1 Tax=Clostridium sp. TaxID=1506 RepID=UPI003D6D0661
MPTVQLGKPALVDDYDMYKVDDISVFLIKNTQIRNEKLHIFMRKFLWIKNLEVDGIQIYY